MDKNALTEQRRETVIGLLKGMDIKKSIEGGFDRDDVYNCMQKLCDLYEKSIEELENNYEEELISLKDKYQKYEDNNDLYVSLIMEAKKSSNEIINQAKNEVESILNEGKAAVAKQEEELAMAREKMETEKSAMAEELEMLGKAIDSEKEAMRLELEAEKEKVYAMKNKYNQQLNSMEGEFSEIKTNILRTAGQIDSLKSKLPNDDEINWDVTDEAGGIEFPAAEVGVENIIEPSAFSVPEAPAMPEIPVASETPEIQPTSEANIQTKAEAPVGFGEQSGFEAQTVPEMPIAPEMPAAPVVPEAPETPEPEAFTLEDLDMELNDITIDLPEIDEKQEDGVASATGPEEISFEGLEELFKDEK